MPLLVKINIRLIILILVINEFIAKDATLNKLKFYIISIFIYDYYFQLFRYTSPSLKKLVLALRIPPSGRRSHRSQLLWLAGVI